jgi:hypothetical protein|tara:strand:- start:15810 stop:16058 length:249 start_codon:yes stop_codon:yes gene_type:complete
MGEYYMDIIKKVGEWAHSLTQTGLSLLALGIILEVLFGGVGIPFWPNISVVENVMGILKGLSAEGLLGLVGAFVLYHLFTKK